jgi:hypothetical protein
VFAGGKRYDEGATIPDDVQVGGHVFDDADEVEGNVAFEAPPVVSVGPADSVDGSGSGPADGKVEDILDRVGDDADAAREALDAEQAKGDKARKSLVEKLQAIVDGSGSGS